MLWNMILKKQNKMAMHMHNLSTFIINYSGIQKFRYLGQIVCLNEFLMNRWHNLYRETEFLAELFQFRYSLASLHAPNIWDIPTDFQWFKSGNFKGHSKPSMKYLHEEKKKENVWKVLFVPKGILKSIDWKWN